MYSSLVILLSRRELEQCLFLVSCVNFVFKVLLSQLDNRKSLKS